MTTKAGDVVWRYTGDGRFLPGVPARDLTADEIALWPEAEQSGLYEREGAAEPPRRDRPGTESPAQEVTDG